MKYLVIVESPTKARTISRFLDKDYEIKFSMGHVMDLPKAKLGVDLDSDFAPQYEVMPEKKKMITELKSAGKNVETIFLATDPDREGEAIAANIQELLQTKTNKAKFKRIVFHEITETAIKHALESPRLVDENLVNAQTARRVLDRLVGYKLSPMLWRKVRRGLSAGRVQSVALRLIAEREREIEKFASETYFTITAQMYKEKNQIVEFELLEIKGEKIESTKTYSLYDGEYKSSKTTIRDKKSADDLVKDMLSKDYKVADVVKREMKRSPFPPFTTSTLQQEASRRFGYAGKRTMSLAQKLYEEGFITYHRTDSTNLAASAIETIRAFVAKDFGDKYLPEKNRFYKAKQKGAQEAHEAIRPTKVTSLSGVEEQIKQKLGNEYSKLYEIIWRRAISSQMSDARIESTAVLIDSKEKEYRLKTNGSVLLFDGFLKIYPQALTDKHLPLFTTGDTLVAERIFHVEHSTTPPPRYNDASLIATLEDKGIGRPSTYASIIGTIADRAYIERVERRFHPTAVGIAVNDFLVQNFSTIDDIPFTAGMENELDAISEGKLNWVKMMRGFYTPFEQKLVEVDSAARVKIAVEETGEMCPECKDGKLVIRSGRFGKFVSCGRFPECKFTKPLVVQTDVICPKDSGNVIQRKTKRGRIFFGCSNYPKCDFAVWKLEEVANYDPNKPKEPVKKTKVIKNTKKRNLVKKVVSKKTIRK